jgi:hypothetical protein
LDQGGKSFPIVSEARRSISVRSPGRAKAVLRAAAVTQPLRHTQKSPPGRLRRANSLILHLLHYTAAGEISMATWVPDLPVGRRQVIEAQCRHRCGSYSAARQTQKTRKGLRRAHFLILHLLHYTTVGRRECQGPSGFGSRPAADEMLRKNPGSGGKPRAWADAWRGSALGFPDHANKFPDVPI